MTIDHEGVQAPYLQLADILRAETLHPDVTGIPVHGVEPSQLVLATRAGDDNRLLAPLLEAARTHLTSSLVVVGVAGEAPLP
ncbi:hypothetical protein ABT352_04800 [Streptosporangium sp. NPDC000563]|uniref:hypothetical protein n=1 Tax=Streptosporangium sp. NPDC000563 TaxID=3154366 RepID=UPI0033318AA1